MTFNYFFLFASEQAARADPDVGPYFLTGKAWGESWGDAWGLSWGQDVSGTLDRNIWAYDLSQVAPLPPGWWCMIQTAAENASLGSNANLMYKLIEPADILFKVYRTDTTNNFTVISVDTAKARYAKNWADNP
jgi:hypothetical protein